MMPKKLARSEDKRIYDYLINMTKHMRYCRQCTGARKTRNPDALCSTGLLLMLDASEHIANLIRFRIAAHTQHPGAIFACPDPASHGASYALTATPYAVYAIQDALF